MRWLPASLVCLLLAVGVSAADRWPATGGGGGSQAEFFFAAAPVTAPVVNSCLQTPTTMSSWFDNWNAGTVLPLFCNSSGNFQATTQIFPSGVNVFASKLVCGLTGGSMTNGQTIELEVRWRDWATPTAQTDAVGTVTLIVAAGGASPGVYGSANVNSLCPYTSTGCGMAVNINSETLTTGANISVGCQVLHTAF